MAQTVREAEFVHALGDLPVAPVHRPVEQQGTVEVPGDDPIFAVDVGPTAEEGPQHLSKPQIGIPVQFDRRNIYIFQRFRRDWKCGRVHRNQPNPRPVVKPRPALEKPTVPLAVDIVHPIQMRA